jgi:putative ABC transport system permease protein
VADVRQNGLGEASQADVYVPWRILPRTGLGFIVRSRNEPGALLRSLKEAVWSVDPTVPFTRMGTLEDHVADSITTPRFYTLLLSAFATLALTLAFVGLYGTISYAVEQRTREIGVRMALGAEPGRVVGMVIGRGMLLTGLGLAFGLGVALVSTRLLSGFVFGVTPRDPLTFAITASALALAALLACWLPARRASLLDPARTLRVD